MKLTVFMSLCVILTLSCVQVSGTNFLEKLTAPVKKAADRVNDAIFFKDDDNEPPSTTKSPEVTTSAAPPSTLPPTTTQTTTTAKTNTTDKDGRENFKGGCSTGFMRTADGRCKPTF
ncbi:hypothetical protein K1T71_005030 [Dendrolimus kikuchii]|uniref:Uncharacterized protein n=1 Tax=Dendrolimus kikuchii TaxID=765133 RepID=A0ACC1D5X1_9NEOP|nr:hypothetical protein K1T71_005030 [Dendrolimus kikuchii]